MPLEYGKFGSVHKQFKRWCDGGRWEYILEQLIDKPDMKWLMIDASHCKVHLHTAGAIGGNQDMERTKHQDTSDRGCEWYATQSPVTKGTTADCKLAIPLITGFAAEMLLTDRGYDTNKIVDFAIQQDMLVVIPPKKNRKEQRNYDEYIYKLRHLVENAFLKLKRWRSIATRYAKSTSAFFGTVLLFCAFQWLRIIS